MYLPYEIMFNILIRLPVASLLRFKLVCRLWRAMISDPYFIKAHLERAKNLKDLSLRRHLVIKGTAGVFSTGYEDHGEELKHTTTPFEGFLKDSEILASCNGLLLVADGHQSYYLWNPSTRIHKQIKCPFFYTDLCRIFGLGYDPVSGAYKFVRAVRVATHKDFLRHPNRNNPVEYDNTIVKVYDFKTECWRRINDFPYNIFTTSQGVVVNGTPHWLVFRDDGNPSGIGIRNYVIIYFDLVEEKFKELATPAWLEQETKYHFCAFEESLCLVKHAQEFPGRIYLLDQWEMDVWVMKEYGVQESWTKLFSFTNESFRMEVIAPLCYTRDGRKILMDVVEERLAVYDPRYDNLNCCYHRTLLSLKTFKSLTSVAYVESLVSPLGGNETVG